MLLFFDTETNGVPNKDYPLEASHLQPHVAQLAMVLTEPGGAVIEEYESLVYPQGWLMSPKLEELTGITNRRLKDEGNDISVVLDNFERMMAQATCVVAHNADFDCNMMTIEMNRHRRNPIENKSRVCTSDIGTQLCEIPPTARMIQFGHGHEFKRASLSDLHQFLFGEDIEGAHDAMVDVRALMRCFFELVDRGVITRA